MKEYETVRKTFAEDTKITVEVIDILAEIARKSVTTFRDRQQTGLKFINALREKKQKTVRDQRTGNDKH